MLQSKIINFTNNKNTTNKKFNISLKDNFVYNGYKKNTNLNKLNLNHNINYVHDLELIYNVTKSDNYFWENKNTPSLWISLLIPCYNTKEEYLIECINSIKEQVGNFGVELVWINDCSDEENTFIQLKLLKKLESLNNFKLIYQKTKINRGISFCLHQGLLLCSNELVFRMDSDDIMINNRIQKQINYMYNNKSCVMCGTDIIIFNTLDRKKKELIKIRHKSILTWEEYKNSPNNWILNHPTLCFKKTAILNIGNYRENFKLPFEDLDLELRVLKKYGILHNISECLVLYRQHEKQTSIKLGKGSTTKQLIELYIDKMIKN